MTRGGVADGRVEALERPDVLAVHVDVHEGRDASVFEHLRPESREARGEVVEELSDRSARALDLAIAADLAAERGRDADAAHACAALPPAQKAT